MNLQFKILPFEQLTNRQLFDCFALRSRVFIVEQNCPYQDIDLNDLTALHILGYKKNKLVAVARIIPPSKNSNYVKIGRVATHISYRKMGFGKQLMLVCLNYCGKNYKNIPIYISAQTYLRKFYEDFNFKSTNNFYLEDNIPHMEMILNAN